jgi:ABC-type transport system substrate-binding protein
MPRTFKATIALIVTLVVLALLTVFNVVQTDSAEGDIVHLRQQLDAMAETNAEILRKLEQGVAVSGQRGGTSQSGGKYAQALDDPDNILEAATEPLVPAKAKPGGTLRRYLSSTPKGFNWLTENGADVQEIATYAHNTFASRDKKNPDKFVPELAYKIEVNDDFTEYTIHLKRGVYWHVPNVDFSKEKFDWLKKPRELTAEDAAFYFELVKNPKVQAGAIKSYYQALDRVEVVDKYTLKVYWKKKVQQSKEFTIGVYPMPKWLYTKTEEGEDIPKASLGTRFNNHWASRYPVGTGPYALKAIEQDKRILLERNENYWDTKPPIEEIEYQIIKDPNTAYLRTKGGELDLTALPPPVYRQDIVNGGPQSPFKTGELEYEVVDRPVYYYFGWNADKPLFSDKRVRRAMTHALNREGIIDNVLSGLGKPLSGSFLPGHPANNPKVELYEYDLDKARNLLEKSGWKDSDGDGVRDKMIDGAKMDFRFTILAYNKPSTRSYLSVFQEDLRKIGVIMTPQPVDWSLMQKKMDERKFDAFTGGWGLSWSMDPYQIWHSSQADVAKGSNRVAFRNDRADEIIEELRVTFDEDKRLELLQEFHMILHEEQPYTFFYQLRTAFAWNPRLEGVYFQKLRPQDLSIPWWIEEKAQSTND